MVKELKQRITWVMIVSIGLTGIGCVRPVDKIKPIEKVSKRKGGR